MTNTGNALDLEINYKLALGRIDIKRNSNDTAKRQLPLWTSYLISTSLSFIICTLRIIMVPIMLGCHKHLNNELKCLDRHIIVPLINFNFFIISSLSLLVLDNIQRITKSYF